MSSNNYQGQRVRGKVSQRKLSISIPYKQRIENLEVVFEALAHQTMSKDDFEIIIGAMDYCEDFISLCKRYIDKLHIIAVMSPDEFAIPWARNLAMRQASGEVIVQMDADTLLPPNALQNLYDSHFAFGQNVCIVGQVIGYGNNQDGSVDSVEVHPYSHFKKAIAELEASTGNPKDTRFQVHHAIPWAFGWTGLIALPLSLIRKHELYFDETFQGWGIDDLEWSYRICNSGTPMILLETVRAIHLPHPRDPEANRNTETVNNRRFLRKWPTPDVELQVAFGDVVANSIYLEFMTERSAVLDKLKGSLGIARGFIDGKDTVLVGIELDENLNILDPNIRKEFDTHDEIDIQPLIGMALPYSDKSCEVSVLYEPTNLFTDRYTSAIKSEADRVSNRVIHQGTPLKKAS